MKTLGTVRCVDELGRIVLPIETRKRLGLEPKDPVEIFVEKDRIILKKFAPVCVFCGDDRELCDFHDKKVCKKCLLELQKEI